jgi:hypothetical protein
LYDEGLSYGNSPLATARNIRLSAALLRHYWIKMTWNNRIHQEGVQRVLFQYVIYHAIFVPICDLPLATPHTASDVLPATP